jgi:hypothetical protein
MTNQEKQMAIKGLDLLADNPIATKVFTEYNLLCYAFEKLFNRKMNSNEEKKLIIKIVSYLSSNEREILNQVITKGELKQAA